MLLGLINMQSHRPVHSQLNATVPLKCVYVSLHTGLNAGQPPLQVCSETDPDLGAIVLIGLLRNPFGKTLLVILASCVSLRTPPPLKCDPTAGNVVSCLTITKLCLACFLT